MKYKLSYPLIITKEELFGYYLAQVPDLCLTLSADTLYNALNEARSLAIDKVNDIIRETRKVPLSAVNAYPLHDNQLLYSVTVDVNIIE